MVRPNLYRITALVTFCSFVAYAFAAEFQHHEPSQVRELRSEKLKLLTDIHQRYVFAFSTGKPVLEAMLDAERDLFRAKLEMFDSSTDRVAIRRQIVENRRRFVDAQVAGVRLGKCTEVDVLTAKVEKIDAELALVNEDK